MRLKQHTLAEAGFVHNSKPITRWDLYDNGDWKIAVRIHEIGPEDRHFYASRGRKEFWTEGEHTRFMVVVEDFDSTSVIRFLI